MPNHVNRPLAAQGLISFRCRSPYFDSWIMIGAKDADDAMREARRSNESASRATLQVWNGHRYVDAL